MTPSTPPLLLHSLLTFRDLLFGCLEAADARRIVEIGSESGEFTVELADWVAGRDGRVISVDPSPAGRVLARAREDERLEIVAGASPEALEGIERGDAYVIDGDHNHWTVLRELRHAYAGTESGAGPLCILHDVGWPSGRRDMYYAPERLPAEALHPHSYRAGAIPGRSELVDGAFHGGGQFAWADHEGGERNGVLTAVEDAMAEIGGLRLAVIPCVFGVGILWPEAAPWAAGVEAEVAPLDGHPLLAALEANRLALYLRVLELQDDRSRDRLRGDRVIADLQEDVGRLDAENARLRLRVSGGRDGAALERPAR